MEEKMLSATKVIQQINVSARTLDGWYKYVQDNTLKKPDNMPKLPEYVQSRPRGPRYWKESDIPALLAFKEWIPKGRNGVMGRINERFWGERYHRNGKGEETVNE